MSLLETKLGENQVKLSESMLERMKALSVEIQDRI